MADSSTDATPSTISPSPGMICSASTITRSPARRLVENYPLVDEDFASAELPRPVQALRERCFGLTTTPARLSQVRHERRPNSRYASLEQCSYELRQAEAMYRNHRLPVINSSTKSVEEMSTVILQTLNQRP